MTEQDHKQRITDHNPMGTDGFEFVEFASEFPQDLIKLFETMGFRNLGQHKQRDLWLFRQGDIKFLVNGDMSSFGGDFYRQHGPCACSFGIRVADGGYALNRAIELGAEKGKSELSIAGREVPAIMGVGGSLLYLVDAYGESFEHLWDGFDLAPFEPSDSDNDAGLKLLDHLTHNVGPGRLEFWADFYERLFNFREIRFFDIKGKMTGLISRALTSPCGKVKIPLNESSDDKSQIAEYLEQYNGEGIQHIALTAKDIYDTVDGMLSKGTQFMTPPPDVYYEMIPDRLPHHRENVEALKQRAILMDGIPAEGGILLQIFTETTIGPIFFEIIQRKGDEGFGEGNFQALFESIERDQIRRGVLQEDG